MFIRLAAGSLSALEEIHEKYGKTLFRRILSVVHHKAWAEEILMDTMYELWDNREKLLTIKNPEGWLYAIAHNKTADRMRHEHRHLGFIPLSEEFDIAGEYQPDEMLQEKEIQKLIHDAIGQLPPREKSLYEAQTSNGYSRTELAKKFNLSESTVKNHLTLARRFIRSYLAKALRSLLI